MQGAIQTRLQTAQLTVIATSISLFPPFFSAADFVASLCSLFVARAGLGWTICVRPIHCVIPMKMPVRNGQ